MSLAHQMIEILFLFEEKHQVIYYWYTQLLFPLTACLSLSPQTQFMDVVCLNRYFGWYRDGGHPETIGTAMTFDLEQWYKKHKKPIIITEYGAGAVAGIHEVRAWLTCSEGLLRVSCV